MFHFDPSSIIQKELRPGINLTDLRWPSAITDAVHTIDMASKAMSVLYYIGVATIGLGLLGAFLGVFSGGRIAALANTMLSLVSYSPKKTL